MRYLGLILTTATLASCSASGLGGNTSSCVPSCNPYIGPSYAAPSYAAPSYAAQTYSQIGHYQNNPQPQNYQTPYQANYPIGSPSYPSPHAYGTHAYGPYAYSQHVQGQAPQLRGLSDPYSSDGYKYGNLGSILYDFDSEKFGIQGRVGYQSALIVGAELEGSISLGSETENLSVDETAIVRGFTDPTLTPSESTLTTEFTNSIAAFALARLPINDRVSVHSRAGLHSTRFRSELDDGTQVLRQNETSVGIAYGLGMNYSVTPRNDIRLDYTVYENDIGGNADSLSVAFGHKF